jgi:membrane protein implicated in regulation of membrane protease activity
MSAAAMKGTPERIPCLTLAAGLLLALFVVPAPWGIVLVASAIAWEILEKGFWFYRTKRIPVAVGPEAMIGQPVDVIAACWPHGKVQLASERWNASCSQGADVGDTVIVEAVERLTLIVASRRGMRQATKPGTS